MFFIEHARQQHTLNTLNMHTKHTSIKHTRQSYKSSRPISLCIFDYSNVHGILFIQSATKDQYKIPSDSKTLIL